MNLYAILKLLHVLSVIVWVGGALTANVLLWLTARSGDRAAVSLMLRHMSRLGPRMTGPAALLTLLTGIGMMVAGRLDHTALWIQWGFAGVVVHFLFGPILLRRAGMELFASLAGEDDERFTAARRRVGRLNVAYLAVLLSVIAVMVLKPTI